MLNANCYDWLVDGQPAQRGFAELSDVSRGLNRRRGKNYCSLHLGLLPVGFGGWSYRKCLLALGGFVLLWSSVSAFEVGFMIHDNVVYTNISCQGDEGFSTRYLFRVVSANVSRDFVLWSFNNRCEKVLGFGSAYEDVDVYYKPPWSNKWSRLGGRGGSFVLVLPAVDASINETYNVPFVNESFYLSGFGVRWGGGIWEYTWLVDGLVFVLVLFCGCFALYLYFRNRDVLGSVLLLGGGVCVVLFRVFLGEVL